MVFWNRLLRRRTFLSTAICLSLSTWIGTSVQGAQTKVEQQPDGGTAISGRSVGTIQSISGNTITLTTDAGSSETVLIQDAEKFVRIAPGQKDLAGANPIQLQDLQRGDRILVRSVNGPDSKSRIATSIVAVKKADLAEKQSREREEWQKHGLGGLVNSVDAASNSISVTLPSLGEKKSVAVHIIKDTILRRYASDSVKFDDAKPAPLDQIKPGDQLRARGSRSADGAEFTADEIVSGTFRNIAGTISTLDSSASTITIEDLVSKKPVTMKITAESQLRKLPPPMAQRIAMRLKGTSAEAAPPASGTGGAGSHANSRQTTKPSGPPPGGSWSGASGRMGRPGGDTADLQQAISRMPASTLADLQKRAAVMVVSTGGGPNGLSTVITLLGGVGPILEASPSSRASTILSPWSLSNAGAGEVPTP